MQLIGSQLAEYLGTLPTLAPLITEHTAAGDVVHAHLGYSAETTAPRVIFTMSDAGEGDTTALDAVGLAEAKAAFECYDATPAGAEAVANALVADLEGFIGTIGNGITVDVVEVLSSRGPEFSLETQQFRCDVELALRY